MYGKNERRRKREGGREGGRAGALLTILLTLGLPSFPSASPGDLFSLLLQLLLLLPLTCRNRTHPQAGHWRQE